jgi:hypothetical protein
MVPRKGRALWLHPPRNCSLIGRLAMVFGEGERREGLW